ncbi:MAG: hypothetical protein N3A69_05150, partial [Leptospiraceae bacterium]|nr:hypothetical protein [Leptospiraceae bacterium]
MDRDFSDGSFDGKEIKENGESSQIGLAELGELGLDLSSADSFLKGEFYDALKYFVDFHDDFSDNFWRGISFCDSDNENCELSLGDWEYPFFIYPFDGQTSGVSSFFFVSLSFFEEIEPSSLSLQTQDGICSGTIQISSDNFTTCLGGSLEADSFFAVIYNENTSFQTGNTYKVKIASIRKADGTALLSTPYVMQIGFTISPSLYAISNELVYDDFNYAVWTRCVLGTSSVSYTHLRAHET